MVGSKNNRYEMPNSIPSHKRPYLAVAFAIAAVASMMVRGTRCAWRPSSETPATEIGHGGHTAEMALSSSGSATPVKGKVSQYFIAT